MVCYKLKIQREKLEALMRHHQLRQVDFEHISGLSHATIHKVFDNIRDQIPIDFQYGCLIAVVVGVPLIELIEDTENPLSMYPGWLVEKPDELRSKKFWQALDRDRERKRVKGLIFKRHRDARILNMLDRTDSKTIQKGKDR